MTDWFAASWRSGQEVHWLVMAARLLAALALGAAVAGIYRSTQRRSLAQSESFLVTLVLLTVVIAMSIQVIGDNIARAFSLADALSIVRFRAAVQDTRDSAFVVFAVVVGMAIGVGHYAVALLGVPITGLAAWLMRSRVCDPLAQARPAALKVRLGLGSDPRATLSGVFEKYLAAYDLRSTTANQPGGVCELNYQVAFHEDLSPADFLTEVSKLEGVQTIKLSRANS
jgi:hypothetical protein